MDIYQIAETLNRLAIEKEFQIAKLQNIRKSSFKYIFSGHSIFKKHNYAFHTGGRSEVQFNVGEDSINGKDVFRYGLAFSFQKGINLQHPIEIISPRIKAFNEFIINNIKEYSDFEIWYHWDGDNGKRQYSPPYPINCIPENWIGLDNFLVVGKYLKKPMADVNEDDLLTVLKGFDKLLPIYQYIEKRSKSIVIVPEKISKICWNSLGWTRPSGRVGKSLDKESHEHLNGYGHEEWLFDFDRLIDGFHYAFLQPINKYRDKYKKNTYIITLYSVNSECDIWYWVADIKNVYIIDEIEEEKILKEYRKRGWIQEMYNELAAVGANVNNFKEWEKRTLFNVRFKPEDVRWYNDEPVPFAPKEQISHTRYTLLDKTYTPSAAISETRTLKFGKTTPKNTNPVTRQSHAGEIEYSRLHDEIQNGLLEWLKQKYPEAINIGMECPIGRASVDVALKMKDGKVTLYEVKTFNEVRLSIRQAIGQLLEYAHYPNERIGNSLVIVSHAPPDEKAKQYITHLRLLYSLPIHYIQFDHNKKDIIQEI
jgi:hypothetical protein